MAAIHTFRSACVARIKCAHPANGDGTAASILKDLRRIKIKAAVPFGKAVNVDGCGIDDLLALWKREVSRLPHVMPAECF